MPKKNRHRKYQKYTSKWWCGSGRSAAGAVVGVAGGTVVGIVALALVAILNIIMPGAAAQVSAASCPDLKIVFARGSGSPIDTSDDYLEFRNTIDEKIRGWGINYEFEDLGYEAKGIGVDNIWTFLGAFFGAGDAYDFGASVDGGVKLLNEEIKSCPDTKFVLGGYSQGAMVVSKGIHSIDSNHVIYAATFGDPKIYLPEGKAWFAKSLLTKITGSEKNILRLGAIPAACKNENLSEYRMYVPDCYAYEGMLGSYRPYQPEGYSGKLGVWCNKYDMFCSSYLSATSHMAYDEDGLYENASRVIANKIAAEFEVEEGYTSPHDTAFLIDSTLSMRSLIEQYKAEALRLARETLDSGGRVALYDYGELDESYDPVEHCNFETCTLEKFEAGLSEIDLSPGGDEPESLLSAGLHVMKKLDWKFGSVKSIVVLTDAGYHNPDIDGVKFEDVVALSKKIDPVNFYIITPDDVAYEYESLAQATDGAVAKITDNLSLLTDRIIARYDALPRVEEETEFASDLPALEIMEVKNLSSDTAEVRFETDGVRTLVILNDAVLGMTEDNTVTINGLDRSVANSITLVPLSETRRGESVTAEIGDYTGSGSAGGAANGSAGGTNGGAASGSISGAEVVIPKAPNTGSR